MKKEMVDGVEESGFWLPPEFLDDLHREELIFHDGNNISKNNQVELDAEFVFPNEFPYETNDAKEMSWVMSTSPQSTLTRFGGFSSHGSGNGSPNGVNSPPTTPLTQSVEDLIHQAVGQVARLRLNGVDGFGPVYPKAHVVGPPTDFQQMERERCGAVVWYGHRHHQQVAPNRKVMDPVSWNGPTRITRPGLTGGSINNNMGAKKTCVGTGVFLPRRYDNDDKVFNKSGDYSCDLRRKTGYGSSTAFGLDRSNVRAPTNKHLGGNMNYNNNNNNNNASSIKSQPRINRSFISDYEMVIARRNALFLQQQKQQQRRAATMLMDDLSLSSRGIYLPQEWTY